MRRKKPAKVAKHPPTKAETAKEPDCVVFIALGNENRCSRCRRPIKSGDYALPMNERTSCLKCARLADLVFLPRGDTALTTRSRKRSERSAVVVKWSRARRRNERQGVLVEATALEQARAQSLADEEERIAKRAKAATRRASQDLRYIATFAAAVREVFPHSPAGVEHPIAEHACAKYSGRVGRSAAAKTLDAEMIRRAVLAHIRHEHTPYDDLMAKGVNREEARESVRLRIDDVLARWRGDSRMTSQRFRGSA